MYCQIFLLVLRRVSGCSRPVKRFLTTQKWAKMEVFGQNSAGSMDKIFSHVVSVLKCLTIPWGKKKRQMLNWSSSFNFWDMTTLILSKERIFPGKFDGTILKVRQLLVVSLMAQNQNCNKKFWSIFLPPSFFLAGLICSACNINL